MTSAVGREGAGQGIAHERDREAAKAVRHIDHTRLRYFTDLYRRHGLADEEAKARAYLFYASLIAQSMFADDFKYADLARKQLLAK